MASAIQKTAAPAAGGPLRDNIWTFISVVIAVVSLVGMVVIYWLQRVDRSVTYSVVSHGTLAMVRDTLNGRVTVLLDGKPSPQLHLTVVRITNTGNSALRPDDFVTPLAVRLRGAPVLAAEVSDQSPDTLGASVACAGDRAVANRLLMNSGDSFTVKVISNGEPASVDVVGRVSDVRDIRRATEQRQNGWLTALPATLLGSLVAALAGLTVNGFSLLMLKQRRS